MEIPKSEGLLLRLVVNGEFVWVKSGRCLCSCTDQCPLGKTGSTLRCTVRELMGFDKTKGVVRGKE